ncbi:uncharacterized protein LOC120329680 isoform X2 [Styela clava]
MKILFLTVALLCFTFAFADEHGDAAKDMSPMGGKADDHSDDDGHTHDGEEADHSHDDDDNDDDHDDDKDEGYGEGSRGGDDERTKIMEFMKDLMGKMPKGGDDDGKKMMEFMGKLLGLVGKGRDHEDGGYGDGEDGGYGEGEDGGYSDGEDGGYGDGDDGGYGDGDDGGYGDGDDSGYGDGDDSGYGDLGKGGKKSDVDALMKIITEVLDQLLPGGKGGYDSKGIMQTGGKKSDVDALKKIITNVLDRLLPGGGKKSDVDALMKIITNVLDRLLPGGKSGYDSKGIIQTGGKKSDVDAVMEIITKVLDRLLPGGGKQSSPAKTITELALGVLDGLFPGWQSKQGGYGGKGKLGFGGMEWNPRKSAQTVTEITLGVLDGLLPGWRSKIGKGSYGAGGYGSQAAGYYGGVQWNPAKTAQGVTEMTLGVLEGLFPGWRSKIGKGSYGAGAYGSKAYGQYGGVQWNPAKKAQGVTEMTLGVLEGLFPGWRSKLGKGSYGAGGYGSKAAGQYGGVQWNPAKKAQGVTEMTLGVLEGLFPGWQGKMGKGSYGAGGYGSKAAGQYGGVQWNPAKKAQGVTEMTLGVLEGLFPGWQGKMGKGSYGAGGYGSKAAGQYGGVQWNPAKKAQGVTEMTLGVLEGLFPGWQGKMGKGSYGAGGYGSKAAGQYGGFQWDPKRNAEKVTELTLGVLEGLAPGWQSKYGSKTARRGGMGGYDYSSMGEKGGFEDWMKGRGWGKGGYSGKGDFSEIMSSVMKMFMGGNGGEWPKW